MKSSHEKKTIYLLDGLKLWADEKKTKESSGLRAGTDRMPPARITLNIDVV